MQCSYEGPPLVCSCIEDIGNSKITELKSTLLMDENIRGYWQQRLAYGLETETFIRSSSRLTLYIPVDDARRMQPLQSLPQFSCNDDDILLG